MLTDRWIKKKWYLYTTECCSDIQRNEIQPFAASWIDLEIAILSKVSLTLKIYTESKNDK